MDVTIFLARFWGGLLIILGVQFLIRGKMLAEEILRLMKDESFTLITGYISLFIGLASIILHNIWVADWRVIITIFGWLALIKGLVRTDPKSAKKVAGIVKDKIWFLKILLVLMIILGAWLVWMSY